MKIAICGSLNFTEEILKIKEKLEARGHEIKLPKSITDFSLRNSTDADNLKANRERYMKLKPSYTKEHFKKIADSDAVLIVNEGKHGIKNYIGGATFAEIILAFHYDKKIFLMNPIPTDEKLAVIRDEIEGVRPVVINGNLDLIK